MKPAGNQILAELDNCRSRGLQDPEYLENILRQSIETAGLTLLEIRTRSFAPHGTTVIALLGESHAVLHSYPEAEHVSVDIFTCGENLEPAQKLLQDLSQNLQSDIQKSAEIKRGSCLELHRPGWLQLSSNDGIDVAVQAEKILHKRISDFQQIEVMESSLFGRTLVLDSQIQFGSSDIEFFINLILDPVREHLSDSTILILGGGDGILANAVLHRGAKRVTSVDIDPQVSEVCSDFFGQLNGDVFSSDRANFVYREVSEFLKETMASRLSYDLILCDLTMHPEKFTRTAREEYLDKLIGAVSEILSKEGKVIVQCASRYDKLTLDLLHTMFERYFTTWREYEAFVPSLCRPWIFAELSHAKEPKLDV